MTLLELRVLLHATAAAGGDWHAKQLLPVDPSMIALSVRLTGHSGQISGMICVEHQAYATAP